MIIFNQQQYITNKEVYLKKECFDLINHLYFYVILQVDERLF